jgi:superkiller protein 3
VHVFNRILVSGKYLPMTYLWLGLCYYHLGKEEQSIASYRKLIEHCPETVMANYYMGVALKSSGKYDEAIVHFERLLNQKDQHVSALYHLGRTHMKNYNYEKAKGYFKKALELDPDNKNAAEMMEFMTED